MICPKCKFPMALFGVNDKGEYKYFCNECKNTEFVDDDDKKSNE